MNKTSLIFFVVVMLSQSACALTFDIAKDMVIYGVSGFASSYGSINTEGDFNGDGFKDIAVGASSSKKAFVYFGGVDFDNVSDVNMTDHTDVSAFGYSVDAGDFNGDGFDDLAVLAQYTSRKVFIYYGKVEFDGTSDLTISTVDNSNSLAVGDLNNDGYDDVIVGTGSWMGDSQNKSYVYYGGVSFDANLDLTIEDHTNENSFGSRVETCDLNNDTIDDLVVTAYYNSKKAFVYYGSSSFDGTSDVGITDHTAVTGFGDSVACGGDLNNDGVADLAIGSPYYSTAGNKVYVYYGGSSFDGTSDVSITDHTSDNYFGEAMSNAGDLNGDGVHDLVVAVGANSVDAYVYYGGSSFDGTSDLTLDETNNNYAVDTTGDLNDDGAPDLVLGALPEVNVYYGAVSDSNRKLHQAASRQTNAFPTIITLQGKLTESATGNAVSSGSIRATILSSTGSQLWQDTFNNAIASGVFNIPLGASKDLRLKEDTIYRLKVEVDVNAATYSIADVTFGDNSPSGDVIKFTV